MTRLKTLDRRQLHWWLNHCSAPLCCSALPAPPPQTHLASGQSAATIISTSCRYHTKSWAAAAQSPAVLIFTSTHELDRTHLNEQILDIRSIDRHTIQVYHGAFTWSSFHPWPVNRSHTVHRVTHKKLWIAAQNPRDELNLAFTKLRIQFRFEIIQPII